jgi:rubrerythrin
MSEIVLTSKKIVDFYKHNENFDCEAMNLFLIDFLEQIIHGMSSNVISSVNSQILSNVGELNAKMSVLSSNVLKLNDDIVNSITIKLQETKKDYIEDYKTILFNNLSTNNEKVSSLLQQNTSQLVDKTTLLLNDIVPKNNNEQTSSIKESLTSFQNLLLEETNKVLQSTNKDESLKLFVQNFENKYSQLIQPFNSIISSSEERIQKEITQLKEKCISENLQNDMNDFFNKFKNSSHKGNLGEIQLETILNQLFPSSEVINTSSLRASCDFKIKRQHYDNIVIETKHYDRNVTLDEVKKFIRDIEEQKCNGIFLSQTSGITSKQNFQIDIHGENIVIYIHNVKYESSIIKMAVDVIDNISDKIQSFYSNEDNSFSISEEVIQEINKEYIDFVNRKMNFLDLIKETNKKMLSQIDEIKFPSLSKLLTQKCGTILNNENKSIVCSICNKFTASNNKSLAAHQRGCKKKMSNIIVDTTGV